MSFHPRNVWLYTLVYCDSTFFSDKATLYEFDKGRLINDIYERTNWPTLLSESVISKAVTGYTHIQYGPGPYNCSVRVLPGSITCLHHTILTQCKPLAPTCPHFYLYHPPTLPNIACGEVYERCTYETMRRAMYTAESCPAIHTPPTNG